MSWRRAFLVAGLIVASAAVITVAMITWHEIGHTVVARLLGEPRATFVLYGRDCIGCNLYDSRRLSPLGNVAVSLGGVAFTMAATVAAVTVLGWRRRPRLLPPWLLLEVAVICYAGDLVWQTVRALELPVPDREPLGRGIGYTDLSAATSWGAQTTGWSHPVVAGAGLTAAALYSAGLAILLWRSRHAWLAARVTPTRPPAAA